MKTLVFVRVKKGNHDAVRLADTARRQLNYFGPIGFKIMKKVTDELFTKNGCHRFVFPNMSMALEFKEKVYANCDPAVYIEICKPILVKIKKSASA